MKRPLVVGLGVVLVLVGVVWTLQGLGYIGGSAMTGVAIWAVVGPGVALVGILVAVRGARRRTGP